MLVSLIIPAILGGLSLVVFPARASATRRLALLSSPKISDGIRLHCRRNKVRYFCLATSLSATAILVLVNGIASLIFLGMAVSVLGALILWKNKVRRVSAPDPLGWAATWDLLSACLRSGLPVPVAVSSVAEGAPQPGAERLRSAAALLSLGADPVDAWKVAEESGEIAEFSRLALRSANSGIALANSSAELAQQVRSQLCDEAEASAQRAGVAMAGPLALCFLPAFLCLGIIPVVMGLLNRLHFLS